MILKKITKPSDLKSLGLNELDALAVEIREALVTKISKYGGHLGSNLGIVELTIALHRVFESPKDKIIFDVSHQSYVHKMLTGRADAFLCEKNYHDVTGYTNPDESIHDQFVIGHTSTSISLACGMAKARDLKGKDDEIIAVIGDASLDGGQAFEAINYACELGTKIIIVINDNNHSIPENYGGLNKHLNSLVEHKGDVENNFFKSLGFEYLLVEDGHSIEELICAFEKARNSVGPIVVHCRTQKSRGYEPAMVDLEKWHFVKQFDATNGLFRSNIPKENYGDLAGEFLLNKIKEDELVTVITASTPNCIGFYKERREAAKQQYIDVGIAEQNAVTIAAGIAKNGGKPVVAFNSTFVQRAYDQIEQEVALNRLPVTIILTHASIYGHTTDTHVGIYDMNLLSNIPNVIYLTPSTKEEYLSMLEWSIEQNEHPVIIRVPWTGVISYERPIPQEYSRPRYEVINEGSEVCIIAVGDFYQTAIQSNELLKKQGINATLINPQNISELDVRTLEGIKDKHNLVVVLEDGVKDGGYGNKIAAFYGLSNMKVLCKGFDRCVPREFVSTDIIAYSRLTPEQICEDIVGIIR